MDSLSKLQEIFIEIFDDENLILTRETTSNDIDKWDSLAQVTIVVACESEFGVKFDLDDIIKLKNIGDIVDIVERKQKKQ